MDQQEPEFILPDWPAPTCVRACTTTRAGGVSDDAFASFNLGDHVGDRPDHVNENRTRLRRYLDLPCEPSWLRQVHGAGVVAARRSGLAGEGDGSVATRPGVVCAVLTADCLPVLLCNVDGERVAALHAGWRGLAAGVLEAGVKALGVPPRDILAWLGPAIGPDAFEVGGEVRQIFLKADPQAGEAFRPSANGRWLADLYRLARQRLGAAGVRAVSGGGWCTYSDRQRFYSYRRQAVTGRMASLIWLESGVAEPTRY